jgi:hypothetical protein
MLFQVKFEVQALEKELKALNGQIYANQQAIHVLEAEWSHLNDPARLSELNARLLGLVPVEPKQLARLQDLPVRVVPPAGGEVASLDALPALVPVGQSQTSVFAPVARSAPRPPRVPEAASVPPTVARAILTTLTGFVHEDERRARQ